MDTDGGTLFWPQAPPVGKLQVCWGPSCTQALAPGREIKPSTPQPWPGPGQHVASAIPTASLGQGWDTSNCPAEHMSEKRDEQKGFPPLTRRSLKGLGLANFRTQQHNLRELAASGTDIKEVCGEQWGPELFSQWSGTHPLRALWTSTRASF